MDMIMKYVNDTTVFYSILGFIIVALISVVIVAILLRNKNKRLEQSKAIQEVYDSFLLHMDFEKDAESIVDSLLKGIQKLVSVEGYAIYKKDIKGLQYTLSSIRYQQHSEEIEVSYSGSLKYSGEKFKFPGVIPHGEFATTGTYYEIGKIPLFIFGTPQAQYLLVLGPVYKKIDKEKKKIIIEILKRCEKTVHYLYQVEKIKLKAEEGSTFANATKKMNRLVQDDQTILRMLLKMSTRIIGAESSLYVSSTPGSIAIKGHSQLTEEFIEKVVSDNAFTNLLREVIYDKKYVLIQEEDKIYSYVPEWIKNGYISKLFIVQVHKENQNVDYIVFFCGQEVMIKDYIITTLELAVQRIEENLHREKKLKEITDSTTDTLKMLAQVLSNANVNTLGSTELMYRYSYLIARELGYSREEGEEIGLAAYLSNIGIIALSDELLNKTGKYDELEYESMKLHSALGAEILEAITGNQKLASYVRYHHERMDGFGYPEGLIGQDIPMGARIVATVQQFLAKIQNREYRQAISLDKALQQLQNAAGKDLDPVVVQALVGWYDKKRKDKGTVEENLGNCYEMRCTPLSICSSCEVYINKQGLRCWSVPNNRCKEHGNECENCFIYTEVKGRRAKTNENTTFKSAKENISKA